jgi:predicted glycoside hydrolase/deacetylase ChbG (UPF0249 family)
MKQLVVNADDLGMTAGVNRAIVEAYRGGIVTSTSLIANGEHFADAAAQLSELPGLSVGLHVNITQGRPLAGRSSLVDRRGHFHKPGAMALRLCIGAVSKNDLEREISAQAQRVVDAGITISHFDSHQNIHLHPLVASIITDLARRMKVRWIRFRGQSPLLPAIDRAPLWTRMDSRARHLIALIGFHLCMRRGDGSGQARRFIVGAPLLRYPPRDLFAVLVRSINSGITEWVCHPGYGDGELRAMVPAQAVNRREAELRLLTDPECRLRLRAAGIELVSYAQLGQAADRDETGSP